MTHILVDEEKPSLESVLEHHGVKGQKWGVRRSLNVSGALVRNTGLSVNSRQLNVARQHAKGTTLTAKVGKRVVGEQRFKTHMDKQIKYLQSERVRIQKGKTTISDNIGLYQRTTVVDIARGTAKTIRQVQYGKL